LAAHQQSRFPFVGEDILTYILALIAPKITNNIHQQQEFPTRDFVAAKF